MGLLKDKEGEMREWGETGLAGENLVRSHCTQASRCRKLEISRLPRQHLVIRALNAEICGFFAKEFPPPIT